MPISLLGIRNTGIKITDEISVPVIKAIVNVTGSLTRNEMNAVLNEIYQHSAGCVSLCAFWPPTRVGGAAGSVTAATYGGTTGFKLRINVSTVSTGKYISGAQLWFNDTYVASCSAYTGYASYETAYMVIFVDENDNIYNTTSVNGLFILYETEEPGVSIQNNKYAICPVWGGSTYRNDPGIGLLQRKVASISDYITNEINPSDTDPFAPGGNSDTGGGTGDFDGTSEPINFPGLPTLSAVDTGFITLFNPSTSELKSLANYMWGDLFDINSWKKIFADPMDAILGLSIVPVAIPNAGLREITVGNIPTGVSMNVAAAQYVSVDCGSINVNEFWGAYLDYSPYTKAEIYLPYIGTHPLSVDDIMNKTIHVKYNIDILSGACSAFVKCGDSVLYTFVGQCSASIPITGNDWTNVVNSAISVAAAIGSMVATGGASAPLAVPALASTAVNGMKPNVERSGSMGSMGGMLGIQTPYLILTRPRQALPTRQNRYTGYPSFITEDMGSLKGYTEIESVHLDGINATEEELTEIESLLKGGVIF